MQCEHTITVNRYSFTQWWFADYYQLLHFLFRNCTLQVTSTNYLLINKLTYLVNKLYRLWGGNNYDMHQTYFVPSYLCMIDCILEFMAHLIWQFEDWFPLYDKEANMHDGCNFNEENSLIYGLIRVVLFEFISQASNLEEK